MTLYFSTSSRTGVDVKGTRLTPADIVTIDENQRMELMNMVKQGRITVDEALTEVRCVTI